MALRDLIHNKFPFIRDVHSQQLLLGFAHDISKKEWPGSADIGFAYLQLRNTNERCTHIADVCAYLWEGERLLSLIGGLAQCSAKLRKQILATFQEQGSYEESAVLLTVVCDCLPVLSSLVARKTRCNGFRQAANAFLYLHKILLLVPLSVRVQAMLAFLLEQMLFRFHFDYVVPSKRVSPDVIKEFCALLDSFPFEISAFFNFTNSLSNFNWHEFKHKFFVYPITWYHNIHLLDCYKVVCNSYGGIDWPI